MQRTWYVWADPETGVVERGALLDALVDAAAILDRIGGVLSVVQERRPTGAPGEMRSVVVAIEWKDRTDAKPQPETPTQVVAQPPTPLPDVETEPGGETGGEVTPEMHDPGAGLPDHDDIGDGLDEATLEEEDLSSLPEHVR